MKQKVDELRRNEQVWIANQLESATKFVETFSPQDAGQQLTLNALDRAFAAWMTSRSAGDVESINAVINLVGVAFGHFLVEALGLKWVIATDEQGSDLALYGLPGKGDILVYPTNFIAKRWERRESNFLQISYQQIVHEVRALSRESGGSIH